MLEELLDKCETQYMQGDYENLIKTCDEVQKIEKDEPASLNYKAISLYYLKKYDEAMEILDYCLELHPTNHYTYNNKALVYIALKEYEKALECCEEGLKSRDLDWLKINKIESLIYLGRIEEAHEYYKSIEIPSYTFEQALDNCGVGNGQFKIQNEKFKELFDNEKYREVLSLCDEVENTEQIMEYRIVSLAHLKRLDEALKCSGEAIESYPNNHELYFIRAKICIMTGNLDEAIENYESAFRLDGLSNNRLEINDYNKCIEIKAHMLIDEGKHDEAIRNLEKIIKIKNGKFEQ